MSKKKKEKDYDVIWIFDPPAWMKIALFVVIVEGTIFGFIWFLTLMAK